MKTNLTSSIQQIYAQPRSQRAPQLKSPRSKDTWLYNEGKQEHTQPQIPELRNNPYFNIHAQRIDNLNVAFQTFLPQNTVKVKTEESFQDNKLTRNKSAKLFMVDRNQNNPFNRSTSQFEQQQKTQKQTNPQLQQVFSRVQTMIKDWQVKENNYVRIQLLLQGQIKMLQEKLERYEPQQKEKYQCTSNRKISLQQNIQQYKDTKLREGYIKSCQKQK